MDQELQQLWAFGGLHSGVGVPWPLSHMDLELIWSSKVIYGVTLRFKFTVCFGELMEGSLEV